MTGLVSSQSTWAASHPRTTNNLPLALTSFIGREQERAELTRLLGQTRLVTLTGAGGVGKTRLALAVAEAVQADYPDGVWLVEGIVKITGLRRAGRAILSRVPSDSGRARAVGRGWWPAERMPAHGRVRSLPPLQAPPLPG